ncbi:MAG: hypothetical protein KC964_31160, partial [Candidatus Omnitrophica bacterium]|nr:hypothetical protein [Candidatus Omnitrophota bacterium]
LDLNLGLRPLPESVHLSLDTAIESDALPSGSTVVVPTQDAHALGDEGRGVRVVGVRNLHEALELIEPPKTTKRASRKRKLAKGVGGSPRSARAKKKTGNRGS